MKKYYALLLIPAVFFLTGFLGKVHVNLDYRFNNKPSENKEVSVYVAEVKDGRQNKSEMVGEAFNKFGGKTNDLMIPTELNRKMTEMIQSKFTSEGYDVKDESESEIIVEVEIQEFQCSSRNITGDASVKLGFKIKDRGEQVLDDSYSASESGSAMFTLSNASYCTVAIEKSMKSILKDFTEDLGEYLG